MKTICLAGCVILDQEMRILLIHRNTEKRTQWELPGGKIEADEAPETAAKRELQEELGIEVSLVKKLGEKHFGEGDHTMNYFWFLATVLLGTPRIMEKGFDDLRYFSWEELRERTDLSENMKNLLKAYFEEQLAL